MVKRIIQIVVVVACLSLIAYVYFQFSGTEKTQVDPIEAIPGNVSFVMQITSFENLHPYMELLDKMASDRQELGGVSFNPVSEWGVLLHHLDSLRLNTQPWFQVLQQGSIYFCSSQQNRGDSWIISIGLMKGSNDQEGKNLMQHWGSISNERKYQGVNISQTGKIHFAIVHDCLVLSSTASLMEDVIIRNAQGDLLRKNETYGEAHRVMSDDQPMHFLMQPDDHSWMELDPMPSGDENSELMFLSGYCIFSDSSHHSFQLTEKGGELGISTHLPSNTVILDAFCYESFELGWDKHEKTNMNSNAYKFWSQAWKSLGDSCSCDLNESMLSWRTGEWGTVVIEINDSTTTELLYYGVRDTLDAIQYLQPLLNTEPSATDHIYACRYPQLFERNQILPIPIEANYITQKGNYLFAANTPGALQQVMTFTDTLSDNSQFKAALQSRHEHAGRFIFQTKNYITPLPQPMMRALSAFPYIMTEAEAIKSEHLLIKVGIPFKPKGVKAKTATQENVEVSEGAEATTKIIAGPFQVINHNTGAKEKFVQYDNNEVALMDSEGKELWKKKIDAKILGQVTQIDALKNNKLQIAFATETSIHVLDRNGNELSGFPVIAKQPITSPLHVADYDGTKKYRLLAALENNHIMNLNVNGKDTEGWKYSGNTITMFIDDFKIGNEDFLMTISSTGQIAFYKRTGELRHSTSTTLTDYNGEACEVKTASTIQEVTITYTTTKGESKSVKVGS